MSSYTTDLVPIISPFLGNDTASRNLAGIICQFRGYTCENTKYLKFRAIYMTRVFQTQALGYGGVDLFKYDFDGAPHPTFANWLLVDLQNLGYDVTPFGRKQGEFYRGWLMTVEWEESEPFMLPKEESDSDDE
jgi:hypothetical protein